MSPNYPSRYGSLVVLEWDMTKQMYQDDVFQLLFQRRLNRFQETDAGQWLKENNIELVLVSDTESDYYNQYEMQHMCLIANMTAIQLTEYLLQWSGRVITEPKEYGVEQ